MLLAFGLRRLLVDQTGACKTALVRGEHKSIASDRVILVPGPDDEIAVVQEVYRLFVDGGHAGRAIAAMLNGRGILTDFGRPGTRGSLHQLLINEKYIGNNVWARNSSKRKQAHVRNPPDAWLRADGAFDAIVDKAMFDRAQAIIASRSDRLSSERMRELLQSILSRRGELSGRIIDEFEGCPSSSAYRPSAARLCTCRVHARP